MTVRNPGATVYYQPIQTGYQFTYAATTTTATLLANGVLRLQPWVVPNASTLTRIGIETTVAASAGGLYRLGIYSDNGSIYPGALFLDAGTLDATVAAGNQEITISQAIPAGLYWIGGVTQGLPTTAPTVRTPNGGAATPPIFFTGTTAPTGGAAVYGYSQASVTGALPGTFTTTVSTSAAVPRVFVKAS